ncbi:PP2C family protein-serine/threonine phosphatase [Actinomadura kijaniata]|uniref:PP2C family protein-serine/threonine phosphatase n=1 Tax=Actinomadura kijaniata TaxID=46161 RepID=UPI00082B8525|nr:SpoIIE family protein phosphatase [Actinomadura kijaniata]
MTEVDGAALPTELAGLRDAARDRALLAEARAALAARLGCPSGEALQHLIWLARDLDVELPEAAAVLVGEVGAPEDGEAAVPARSRRAARATLAAPPSDSARAEVLRRVNAVDTPDDAEILDTLPDDPQARAAMDASLDGAAHLVPVRSPDGRVVDFLYAALNDSARDLFGRGAADLAGRRLLHTDPGSALSGLFDAYVAVLETGEPYARGPFAYSTAQDGVPRSSRMTLRCVRVPTGVVVAWHYHREEDRIRYRHDSVERLAQIGFGEWDLVTGEAFWSPRMLANYELAEAPGSPSDLPKTVAEEDVPLVEDAISTLLSRRESVEFEHRVATPGGRHRHLWVFAEPVVDGAGLPVAVNIVSQDITRRRGMERALAETRRAMLRQQLRTAQEHRVAATLRRAILPDPGDLERLPGLRVTVRSLAAESAARIGGDWFATRALADGRGLFAVGDAAGHGLPAAAAMARTRGGLLGLAYTGRPPGRLVAWLNELVGDLEPAATGTAVVARFDPESRILEWTSAGHPPPILVRDGQAVSLEHDPDPILGALPGLEYTTHTVQLRSGDHVLLYTDGLVERRGVDLDEGIARLVGILGRSAAGSGPDLDRILAEMGHDRAADDTTLFCLRVE